MIPSDVQERLIETTGFRISQESDDEGTYYVLIEQATGEQWDDDFSDWGETLAYATTRLPHLLEQRGRD